MSIQFVKAESLPEALELLARDGDDVRLLAGGASLALMIREKQIAPALLVSIERVLAEQFGLPPESIRVIVPPLGGGYGGKGHVRIEPLAWKVSGRPVKLMLTRPEEFITVTKHAATIAIKTGVRRDGTLTPRQVTLALVVCRPRWFALSALTAFRRSKSTHTGSIPTCPRPRPSAAR
jgi:hypothetical protein